MDTLYLAPGMLPASITGVHICNEFMIYRYFGGEDIYISSRYIHIYMCIHYIYTHIHLVVFTTKYFMSANFELGTGSNSRNIFDDKDIILSSRSFHSSREDENQYNLVSYMILVSVGFLCKSREVAFNLVLEGQERFPWRK